MNNVVVLMLGDASGDGHDKKEMITIRTNLTKGEMIDAYSKGIQIIGVDVINSVAVDYEDSHITQEQYDAFTRLGYQFFIDQDQKDELESDGSCFINKEEYVQMYFFTVKTGDSSFQYLEVLGEDIDIGGYGFFY